jgi:hypothetical protein
MYDVERCPPPIGLAHCMTKGVEALLGAVDAHHYRTEAV